MAEKKQKKKPVQIINDLIMQELMVARLGDEKLVWQKPWFIQQKQNYVSGREYNAVNKILLGTDGEEFYLTLKQINELQGTVKEFNWCYCYNSFRKTRELKQGEKLKFWEKEEVIQGVRYAITWSHTYTQLLRISDTDIPVQKERSTFVPRPDLEDFIKARIPVEIKNYRGVSMYDAEHDTVLIPEKDRFDSPAEYYKNLFHEVAHAMGSQSRLNRFTDLNALKDNKKLYAREELTAELTAAAMMHKFGIEFDIKNTAAYIEQWIEALQSDEQLFVISAQQAESIIKYLHV